MNMTVLKTETVRAVPLAPAAVVRFKAPRPSFLKTRLLPALSNVAARVLPPLIMLALLLAVWQLLCNKPNATLPAPTRSGARRATSSWTRSS